MIELSILTWRECYVWFLQTVFLYLPAVAANIAPLLASMADKRENQVVVRRWYNQPIDERILGQNKTWRGLAVGIFAAGGVFWIQADIHKNDWQWLQDATLFSYPDESVATIALLIGGGALLGDAVKSLFKRLAKRPPGSRWYPMDQIDFIGGATICLWLAGYAIPAHVFLLALFLAAVIQPLCRKGFWLVAHKFFPFLSPH